MRKYKVKRDMRKKIASGGLYDIAVDVFGSAEIKGDWVIASYGAIKKMAARFDGASLFVELEMDKSLANNAVVAADTIKVYNKFLLEVTGYSAKERKKHISDV